MSTLTVQTIKHIRLYLVSKPKTQTKTQKPPSRRALLVTRRKFTRTGSEEVSYRSVRTCVSWPR